MRRKKKFPMIIGLSVLALIFSSIGYIAAHYKYSGQITKEKLKVEKERELLRTLIKAQEDNLYNIDENNEATVTNYNDTINNKTQLIYKTLYTQCEHIIEEEKEPIAELIGLNRVGFKEYLTKNQSDWELQDFSKEKVVLLKKIDEVCTGHYLISVNEGYITIYKYDEENNKELIEQTNIPINILPILDQEKLKKGIFLETEKEVYQLLEDYSS